jgi:ribosomal protein S14
MTRCLRPAAIAALAGAAATMLLTGAQAQEDEKALYTWVDDTGVVHYSDTPDDPRARRLAIGTRRTDLARVQDERQQVVLEREARAEASIEAAEREAQAAREAAEQERRCARARARLRTLSVSRRPFRVDENGQQLFLTEGQLDEERLDAEQAVSDNCT